MVYDCFSFFNEFDLLEIRLHVLAPVVDRFILVEADRTHSNKPKPFFFDENKKRYEAFLEKIIHIKVTEYPPVESCWTIENYQRNMILEGLKICAPSDIILISDLDEIPNPDAIRAYKTRGICKFKQELFYYFLNYKSILRKTWYGTRILTYQDISENITEKYPYTYGDYFLSSVNNGCTPTKIRMINRCPVIKNGGWHFSYLGGVERIKYKIASFAHQEYKAVSAANNTMIDKKIKEGKDFNNRFGYRFIPVKLKRRSFPAYIVNSQSRYAHLIYAEINIIHNIQAAISAYIGFCVMLPYKAAAYLIKKIRKRFQ